MVVMFWGGFYREFNTNMTFYLKSKVEELTLILFIFYCTENRNKAIKEKHIKKYFGNTVKPV